jgi:threonyl-tRNA synthetase
MLGSLERFFGALLEHYAGVFPPWLAPVQIRLIPVNADLAAYASEIAARFRSRGLRAEVDEADGKLTAKIRNGELAKIPYLGVVGKKEQEAGTVSVRRHGGGDLGAVPVERLLAAFADTVADKTAEIKI